MRALYSTYLLTAVFFFTLLAPSRSQDIFAIQAVEDIPCAPLINNIEGRQTQSLNGTWNALIDPSVFSLNDRGHFIERNYKPEPSELVEANVEEIEQ